MDRIGDGGHIRIVHRDGNGCTGAGGALRICPGDGLRSVVDGGPAAEAAVHQDLGKGLGIIRQGGAVRRIDGVQCLTGGEVGIVQIWPDSGEAFLRRDLRQAVDPPSVLEGDYRYRLAVRTEGQFHLREGLGYIGSSTENLEGSGLCFPGVADAVDGTQRFVGEQAIGHRAVIVYISCNGAGVSAAVNSDETTAIRERFAITGDATYIILTGKGAFGPAQADAAVGPACNTADIAAVGGDGAVALAAGDLTDVRLPHDAAGIVIPSSDSAAVDAAGQKGTGLIVEIQGVVSYLGRVTVRVEVNFDPHGTHNAA